ncbi:unnamed protein product [Lactuca saligna]|uniref:Phospholipase-like protein n=1 Tax=Lactuca saligna TaxID=75948 RepID=A0AA35UX19_LACSI|nr:unnamed protein product [Lactuca saligna]
MSPNYLALQDEDDVMHIQLVFMLKGLHGRDVKTGIPAAVYKLADNIDDWNRFAWSTYFWTYTSRLMRGMFKKIEEFRLFKQANPESKKVHNWKSDDTDENKQDVKDSHEIPPRVVVDQVFGDTKGFDKILSDKGAHYLETNTVVYPNFICTDKTIFPNQVFDTTGNPEKINPEFNKIVENNNQRAIDAETNAPDNQTSESSKHNDDSTITTMSITCESVPGVNMVEQTFEGEKENMNHQVDGEHSQNYQEYHLEGEHQDECHVEGEHQDEHHVKGEHDEIETINLDENDEFHVINDNFSVA